MLENQRQQVRISSNTYSKINNNREIINTADTDNDPSSQYENLKEAVYKWRKVAQAGAEYRFDQVRVVSFVSYFQRGEFVGKLFYTRLNMLM